MKLHQPVKLTALLALSLIFHGCAATKTSNVSMNSAQKLPKPSQILIQDFTIDPNAVKGSSSPLAKLENLADSQHEETAKKELIQDANDALYDQLSSQLTAMGFKVVRAQPGQIPKQGEVIISGQFTGIDEGNAVRRALVGFGAGQSSVDATARVVSANQTELLSLRTHADSGETPGAAVTAGVGAAAQVGATATAATSVARGGAKAYKSAISTQASDIAEKIGDEFGKLAKSEGWVTL